MPPGVRRGQGGGFASPLRSWTFEALPCPLRARPQDTVLAGGDTCPPTSPQAPRTAACSDPPWSPVLRSLAFPAERKQMFLQKALSHR